MTILMAGALAGSQEKPAAVKTLAGRAGQPSLEVRLFPFPVGKIASTPPEQPNGPRPVARVEIARQGQSKPFQTLTVRGASGGAVAPDLVKFSRFEDANFDGYADLLLANEFGATWMGYEVFLYDPAAGSFVENDLSRALSRLGGQDLIFHRDTREIELTQLTATGPGRRERFVIQGSRLRQVGR
jgi:hypothetical protein